MDPRSFTKAGMRVTASMTGGFERTGIVRSKSVAGSTNVAVAVARFVFNDLKMTVS
jgi:hypothetical protein